MRTDVASPVDPLSDLVEGRYEDELVVVTPRAPNGISHWPSRVPGEVRTRHFTVVPCDGRLLVTYDLPSREISDDLVGVISAELFAPVVVTPPLQLLAYHVAKLRGCDVDQPRNLAKSVTVE